MTSSLTLKQIARARENSNKFFAQMATEYLATLDDLNRQMAINTELATENERLRDALHQTPALGKTIGQ